MFEAIEFTRYLLLIFGIFEIISKFWPSTNFRQYLFSLPSPKFEQKPANLETKISRSLHSSENPYQLPCEGGAEGTVQQRNALLVSATYAYNLSGNQQ